MLQIESLPTGQGPFLQFKGLLLTVGKERYGAGVLGGEGEASHLFVLPRHIDGDAAAGPDAADRTIFPVIRQGGEEFDGSERGTLTHSIFTLHQHLDDTGATAEVTIDLERRVGVEQVGVGAAATTRIRTTIAVGTDVAEQFAIDMIGVLCIVQSGIEVDAPASAPAGGLVAFQFKGARGSTVDGLLGVCAIVKVMARVDAEEVTLMTMVRILVFPVIEPLLEVAFLADFVGVKAGEGGVELGDEGEPGDRIAGHTTGTAGHTTGTAEYKGGVAGIGEAFANHGDVGKAAEAGAPVIAVGGDERVLGRSGRGGDERADV